jgi:cell division protein FtsL
MIYKILIVAIIIYIIRMVYKSLNVIKTIQENQQKQDKVNRDDDIVDAEFTVVDKE